MTTYFVTILYRTPTTCSSWSAPIVARDMEQADRIARAQIARQRRVCRIDCVTIRGAENAAL